MAMPAAFPGPDEAVRLPVDELAMGIPWLLVGRREGVYRRQDLINEQALEAERPKLVRGQPVIHSGDAIQTHPELARALAEGWDWLAASGLLARDPVPRRGGPPDPEAYFVTRRAQRPA